MRFLLLFFLILYPIFSEPTIPDKEGPITDDSGYLNEEFIQSMNRKLSEFSKSNGAQIGVLVMYSIEDIPISDFSIQVVEKWKLGRKDINDGVLILLSLEQKKVRIEVGYGLEHILTDLETNKIIKKEMVPSLKKKDYEKAIKLGINAIIKKIEKGETGEKSNTIKSTDKNSDIDDTDSIEETKTVNSGKENRFKEYYDKDDEDVGKRRNLVNFIFIAITILLAISIFTHGLRLDHIFAFVSLIIFSLLGYFVSIKAAFVFAVIAIFIYIILYFYFSNNRRNRNDDDDDDDPGFWTFGGWGNSSSGGGFFGSDGGFFGGGSSGGDFGDSGGDFGGGGSDSDWGD